MKPLLYLTLILLFSMPLGAQMNQNVERFHEERIAFFNENLQLTPAQAEKFWPIYNDFNNRRIKLGEDEKNLLNFFDSNAEHMSQQEIEEALKKYIDLQHQEADLLGQYTKKFEDILPSEKVMLIFVTERKFRVYLLQKINDVRGGPQNGRGMHRGRMLGDECPL